MWHVVMLSPMHPRALRPRVPRNRIPFRRTPVNQGRQGGLWLVRRAEGEGRGPEEEARIQRRHRAAWHDFLRIAVPLFLHPESGDRDSCHPIGML